MSRVNQSLGNSFKFFRDVRSEFAKVIWPTRRETGLYLLVTVVTVGLVAALIFVSDLVLNSGMQFILGLGR
jgi:preprotein translocase subunit SecE